VGETENFHAACMAVARRIGVGCLHACVTITVHRPKGVLVTTLTIRLPKEDKELIKSYASLHGRSIADVVRKSVLERIEDEFDLQELNEAVNTSDGDFVSHDEVMRRYGLR
jgi:predicted DNA-binding protein